MKKKHYWNERSIFVADEVLKNIESYMEYGHAVQTWIASDDLSIFSWKKESLSKAELRQMRSFVKHAIELGFKGFVCFRVGEGMWAYKAESENGHAPLGDWLYRSFSPYEGAYYDVHSRGKWLTEKNGLPQDAYKTIHMLKRALAA